jgi:hypothetical protein
MHMAGCNFNGKFRGCFAGTGGKIQAGHRCSFPAFLLKFPLIDGGLYNKMHPIDSLEEWAWSKANTAMHFYKTKSGGVAYVYKQDCVV